MKHFVQSFLFFFVIFQVNAQKPLEEKILKLTPNTIWALKKAVSLQFPSFHPQGMVKIENQFYMSSVEVTKSPKNGDAGEGIGHLFKFDSTGTLLADLILGETTIYHPGGIDFDGKFIWIPVAEYRPKSKSIIYKVEPKTLKVTEMLRFDEHIGAIIHNFDSNFIMGMSWGSRNFYEWKQNAEGKIINEADLPDKIRIPNPSFYIDYQDCHYIGNNKMLCSGFQKYTNTNGIVFRLGGFELINLLDKRPLHQVPIKLWSPSGLAMTNNPFWVESTVEGIKAYFIPDDDKTSTLFMYEAELR
ncbi:hypothetical protein EMA8858_00744 [Emticicia aquatica]|jgi:hypothetical protein|uniref:Glutamine cyclotransferase n=1 Tax=Emticicia aquatica TaxID=1681835 RepID=A0ABM9AMY7_9BACT|nr:DUF6454 family protein [Emticicia aquatica]CAH0994632.1 hypothetical protein EMA8858_00744 [Emticicia aquatica]